MTILPNQDRGTMIFAELPNSLAIAVTSDTCRIERLFNFGLLTSFCVIQMYNRALAIYFPARHTNPVIQLYIVSFSIGRLNHYFFKSS
jgi:hypothetical protein